MEHDLRANAFFAFVAREGRYRFSLAEIMLESKGWGGTTFRRKAIPRWKRVLESNPQMGTVRLLRACRVTLAFLAAAVGERPALPQANFDRPGGDDACKAACAADNKCRAWTYARPGYAGKEAHCFLKKDIKPPRRKAGFTSGVVR